MAKLEIVKYQNCEKEFKQKSSNQKFCNIKCKKEFYGIKMVEDVKICQICGVKYKPKAHDTTSKYCSPRCKDISRGRSGNSLNKNAKCDFCGSEFEQKTITQRFCSNKCRQKQRNLNKKQNMVGNTEFEHTCKTCGDIFYSRKDNAKNCQQIKTYNCPICNTEFTGKCGSSTVTCGNKECAIKYISIKTQESNLSKYGVTSPAKREEVKEKMKRTNLEKYGNPSSLHGNTLFGLLVQEKVKQTNLEKYGTEHYFASEDSKEKIKETNLEKYGYECNLLSPVIQEKIKQTNLERYGAENPFESEIVKEKIKETVLEKYGVDNVLKSKEIQNKCLETTKKKFGYENDKSITSIFQFPEIINKVKQTNLEKYGVSNVNQIHIKNYQDWLNLENFIKLNYDKFNIEELSLYFNIHIGTIRQRVREYKLEHLFPNFYSMSMPEETVLNKLNKIFKKNIKINYQERSLIWPYELDFYIPDYKLAIEVSPIFYHSHLFLENKEYHYNKFKLCKEKGVELITIFDWHDLDKIMKFIESKVDSNLTKIYARNCFVNLTKGLTKEHKTFLSENHILGKINNSNETYVVELKHNSVLVGLGVFEDKDLNVELRRLAFKDRFQILGGASKILKTWLKFNSNKPLITFSDNDLGTGSIYKKLGFEVIEENKGTLNWYNDKYKIKIPNLSLVKQGTDRLLKNFPNYQAVGMGEDLPSNQEIIQMYGFVPIYDCGYTKWRYKIR